jgi:hypothetical protein
MLRVNQTEPDRHLRPFFNFRAAGIPEPEHLANFIECLARRIITVRPINW